MEQQSFAEWCLIELFGRTRLAGLVSEKTIAGAGYLQVQIPDTKSQPAFTKFISPSSIYAITPVTEETARFLASQINEAPIQAWDIRKVVEQQKKQLTETVSNYEPDHDELLDEDDRD